MPRFHLFLMSMYDYIKIMMLSMELMFVYSMLQVASSALGLGPQAAMQVAERLYTQGFIRFFFSHVFFL